MTGNIAMVVCAMMAGFVSLYVFTPHFFLSPQESDLKATGDPLPEKYPSTGMVAKEETGPNDTKSEDTHILEEVGKKDSDQEKAIWSFSGSSWTSNGVVPPCDAPFVLQTPVDITQAVGALRPGQVRGVYKGHGGFRFDESTEGNIEVRAPVGGYLVQASQYLEQGERQYLLFFSVPCGYFYRFDHIRTLSPEIERALSTLPPATEGDSRTTYIQPPIWIDQGELLATQIGILPTNIFVDFGLYDVRKPNGVAPDSSWIDMYKSDIQFGHYGVCFFDFLPNNDGKIIRSLPAGIEGKKSDYCK